MLCLYLKYTLCPGDYQFGFTVRKLAGKSGKSMRIFQFEYLMRFPVTVFGSVP